MDTGVAGRHRRQGVGQNRVELDAEATKQDGEAPFRIHQLAFQLRQRGLRVPELLAYLIELEGGDQPAVVAGFRQRFALQKDIHGLAGERGAPAQIDDLEVRRDGCGQDPDARREVVRLGSQVFLSRRPRIVAGPAPEIEFVGEIDTQRVGRDAEPLRKLEARDTAARDFLELLAESGVGGGIRVGGGSARLDGGEEGAPRDPGLRPGLLNPRHGFGKVEIGGQHGIDHRVEHRILKGGPPLSRLVGARTVARAEAVGKLRDRFRHRRGRREGTSRQKE